MEIPLIVVTLDCDVRVSVYRLFADKIKYIATAARAAAGILRVALKCFVEHHAMLPSSLASILIAALM